MIRTAEFYGLKKVYIFDQNNLLLPPTQSKKARAEMAHMARVWTAGAIEYIEIEKVEDIDLFLQKHEGRTIATLVEPSATHLNDFVFQADDLILFGNERDGIPPELFPQIQHSVYLPNIGHTPCLNVAVTFGIVLHHALNSIK